MNKYFQKLDKKIFLVISLIVILNLLPQLYFWDHISDDAFISFRYANRMINGQGLTFNDGEMVEGFSNPLWIFSISLFSIVTNLNLPDVARVLGLTASMLLLFFVYLITKILFSTNKSFILFICILLCVFFTPGFHVYSTAGLEGPFMSLLLISTVYFSITKKGKHLIIPASIVGMVGITRPEGLLYGILWLLFTYKFNDNVISFLKRSIIVILPSMFYILFRLIYYGEILPNTAFAKPSGTYSSLFGTNDIFVYLITLSIPLTIIIVYHYLKFDGQHKKFLLSSASLLLANFIFIVYAGGDWMFFGRFFLPVWPLLLLTFFFLLLNFLQSISPDTITFKYLSVLCLITIILSQLLLFKDQWFKYNSKDDIANVMKGKDQIAVGQWLNQNVKPNSTVATLRLGGISYGAPELTFYDTFGLTDKEVTSFRRGKFLINEVEQNPVIKRKPNILAVINDHGYRLLTVEMMKGFEQFLENNYDLIKSFPQGSGVFFEIWIDKEKKDKVLN